MREQIVKFIDCHVPTETCNFRCPYCYIAQSRAFENGIEPIGHSPREIRAALSKKRLGGTAYINFCAGGETLLSDEVLPIVHALLEEGHYVQIVTNGSVSKRFDEIATWSSDYTNHLFIKFSYHYTELKRMKLLDRYFENVTKVRDAGVSFSVEITPFDEEIALIDEIKMVTLEKVGALPHITVARNENDNWEILTKLSHEDYVATWGPFDSEMFRLKMQLLNEPRTEFCYGGEWTFFLNIGTGALQQCYRGRVIDNIYTNVEEPLKLSPIGHCCPEKYCYNGHAWMTFGCIPGGTSVTYADIRNRVTKDGNEWLGSEMKEFLSHKLEETNIVYEEKTMPKVLLLGDSISEGYRGYVSEHYSGVVDVMWQSENVRFTTYFLRNIDEWAQKLKVGTNVDVVIFNVGLWDLAYVGEDEPLVSVEEYQKNLQRICYKLKQHFCNAGIVFATTTPVLENGLYSFHRKNQDIIRYNEAAVKVASEQRIEVLDLYKEATELTECDYADWTHFNEQGYRYLAQKVIAEIDAQLLKNENGTLDLAFKHLRYIKNLPKEELMNRRYIVYGAGKWGMATVKRLQAIGVNIAFVCDSDETKSGNCLDKVPVVWGPKYIEEMADCKKDVVIVAIKNAGAVRDILLKLDKKGTLIFGNMSLVGTLEARARE